MLDSSILMLPDMPPIVLGATRPEIAAPTSNDESGLAKMLAAVVAIQTSLNESTTIPHAGNRVATMVREHLAADRVILLWRYRSGQPLRLIGDEHSQPSRRAHGSDSGGELRMIVAAGEEIAARDSITRWPATDVTDRHALMAVKQLSEYGSIRSLLAVRLIDEHEIDRGALLVFEPESPSTERFLRVIDQPLTAALVRVARSEPSRIDSLLRGLAEYSRGRKRNLVALISLAVCAILMFPMRYRISASLELQPVQRRYIAVPFDGPLESAHVKPGDVVVAGELLATINPREIDYEIAGNLAHWNRAEQERKTLMAEHDFAGSKLADLESQRLRLQTELLQHKRDNFELRSPIAGVVVSGDIAESEGMPMTRGETLLEIAPLGKMIVEIGVPESEIADVRPGMEVRYYLHAFPSHTIRGKIDRIHPRAELREHDNVFIAEVLLQDPSGLYRPGMRGRASIAGDRHPLGWNLFHHAFFAARYAIGW